MNQHNGTCSNFGSLSDLAFEISQSWYCDSDGKDILELNGVTFGSVAQIDVFLLVKNSLEREECRISSDLSFDSVTAHVKERHLEWQIKAIASRLVGPILGSAVPQSGIEAAFIYDVWNSGSISSLAAVQAAMNGRCQTLALTFEPRTFKMVRNSCRATTALYPCGFLTPSGVETKQVSRYWLSRYIAHRPYLLHMLESRMPGSSQQILDLLDRLMQPFLAQLARDRARALWFLDTAKPGALALATDCHKWSRLLTLLAKPKGIRTLVIQHGVPVAKHAYVPVVADRMAVWGKVSATRLESWGAPPEKLVLTGQPRFDRLPELRRKRERLARSHSALRVVVATSPLTNDIDTTFMQTVLDGFAGTTCILEPVLKLHPGDSKEGFFRALIKDDRRHWRVERYCDTHRLLADADAVITTQSTIGIEALALGVPLIVVDLPGIPEAVPYGETCAAFVVTTPQGLSEALEEVRARGGRLADIMASGDQLAENYLYRLDGQATQRVLDLLSDSLLERESSSGT